MYVQKSVNICICCCFFNCSETIVFRWIRDPLRDAGALASNALVCKLTLQHDMERLIWSDTFADWRLSVNISNYRWCRCCKTKKKKNKKSELFLFLFSFVFACEDAICSVLHMIAGIKIFRILFSPQNENKEINSHTILSMATI